MAASVLPDLERLEPRRLLVAYVVDTPLDEPFGRTSEDPGDRDGRLSLREAVYAASFNKVINDAPAGSDTERDVITFASGIERVVLGGQDLPVVDDVEIRGEVTIDANGESGIFFILADYVVLDGLTLTGGDTNWRGGAILFEASGRGRLSNLTVTGNNAASGGGGIALFGKAGGLYEIIDCVFTDNTTDGAGFAGRRHDGGGVLLDFANARISRSIIADNVVSSGQGGGIGVIAGGSLVIEGSLVSGNAAAAGGGIAVANSEVTIADGSVLRNNAAATDGGGLHLSGDSTATVTESALRDNAADRSGGGLWQGPNGTASLSRVVIDGNLAAGGEAGQGGGVMSVGGTVSISGSSVRGNIAPLAGGGLELGGGTMLVSSSLIAANVAGGAGTAAPGRGGGFHATAGEATFSRSVVEGNSAWREGGGLWNPGGSRLFLLESSVRGNRAESPGGLGGGVFNAAEGEVTVAASVFIGNNAGEGGGLYNAVGAEMLITTTNIRNNLAVRGGGLFNEGSLVLDDTVNVLHNVATDSGGGLFAGNGTATLAGAVFADNTPEATAGPGTIA